MHDVQNAQEIVSDRTVRVWYEFLENMKKKYLLAQGYNDLDRRRYAWGIENRTEDHAWWTATDKRVDFMARHNETCRNRGKDSVRVLAQKLCLERISKDLTK